MDETATPVTAPVDENAQFESIMDKLGGDDPAPEIPETSDETDAGDVTEVTPDEAVDEQADEVESEEETPDEPKEELDLTKTVKVRVNGEEVEVPLEEALKGYSRLEDYKAKTAQVAEERRVLQSDYAERLTKAADIFRSLDPVLSQASQIDWDALAQQDPAQYVQLKHAYDQRVNAITAVTQEAQRVADVARQETLAKEEEGLLSAMPQLADPEKAQGFLNDMQGYLAPMGVDIDDIAVNFGHEGVIIAHKAMLYDRQQEAKAKLPEKKVAPKPQVKPLTPKAAQSSQRSNTRKPGPGSSSQDVVDWVLARI